MSGSDDLMKNLGRRAREVVSKLAAEQREAERRDAEKKAAAAETKPSQPPPPPPPRSWNIHYETERPSPKGTAVVSRSQDAVVVEFKAALRTWWVVPYVMLPVTIAGSIPLGVLVGIFLNPLGWQGSGAWFGGSLLLTPVILIALNILLFGMTQPWVRLVATPAHIQVGNLYFRREQFGGMRIGYEIEHQGSVLKNDFHDVGIGLQGIRLVYGPWGEDLPWLVNRYHAAEIVLWLNLRIAETAPQPTTPIAESGYRPQRFE